MKKQHQVSQRVDPKTIRQAVKTSSEFEGIYFERAIADQKAIDILIKHGRAFWV